MAEPDSGVEPVDQGEDDLGLVPYAPDFTPATLGKRLGEDEVLPWLLGRIAEGPTKAELAAAVAERCLSHIQALRSRMDMASHVIQALQNYLLMVVDDSGRVHLSEIGVGLQGRPGAELDEAFARHILTRCNGYRLVEEIWRLELSAQKPRLEELARRLDRNSTSKSISSMRAWLARAGVFPSSGYIVNEERVEQLLGAGYRGVLRLDAAQTEFLLAARALSKMSGAQLLAAPDVRRLAALRGASQISSKSLARFVKDLADFGVLELTDKRRTSGGSQTVFRLAPPQLALSDDELYGLSRQSSSLIDLKSLPPISEVLSQLSEGSAEARGIIGELLAVHVCLLLGLRVVGWRTRQPVEVDLTATRPVGLSYQRWYIQVKNTAEDVAADRVDRELGVAAGMGASHILFVVPRARMTRAAAAEIATKNRLTHLHIYALDVSVFEDTTALVPQLSASLRAQLSQISRLKEQEALRREALS